MNLGKYSSSPLPAGGMFQDPHWMLKPWLVLNPRQADLRDTAGSVPGHHKEVNITIKRVM